MFLDPSIPSDYKYIVELNNNFIILSNKQRLDMGAEYTVYIQFFSPSTEVIKLDNYRLTLGNADNIDWNYFYFHNNDISSLDSSELIYNRTCSVLSDDYISSELFDRHDYWSIGVTVGLFLALFIIIVNLATSLIHRGGIFHA